MKDPNLNTKKKLTQQDSNTKSTFKSKSTLQILIPNKSRSKSKNYPTTQNKQY